MSDNTTIITGGSGQFNWFKSIGATDEAVMVLNDQPILFTILLIVLVSVIAQIVLLWYIGFATMKPEQKKKKDAKKPAGKTGGGLSKFLPAALKK
jgi:hypothetical protein